MKAKCPHCDSGCERCSETGFIEVHFAEEDIGHYHAILCNLCGRNVGGALHRNGTEPPKVDPYSICPWCNAKDLRMTSCQESIDE